MEELKKTIASLNQAFLEKRIYFDGKDETFWEMLNYQEVQRAIVDAVNNKLCKLNSKFRDRSSFPENGTTH